MAATTGRRRGGAGTVPGAPLTPAERLDLARDLFDWVPHEGQRRFLTATLDDGSEPAVLVAACGRRWGKTEGLSADIAVRLLTEPDLGQLLVGPTRDQAEGLFDAVVEKIDAAKEKAQGTGAGPASRFAALLVDLEVRRSPYPHVRRRSDGVTVLSARSAGRNGRNLRGKGTTRKVRRFRVVVDEAAFVPDAALEQAIRPMLATVPGGGQLVQIGSPAGRRGQFYRAFLKGERREGRHRSVRLPSSGNPLVDRAFLDEMRQEMTARAFAAEFEAEFVDAAGAVFAAADIDACRCEDDYGRAPLWGVKYVAGVDFARRGDWSAVAVLEVGAGGGARLVELLRLQGLGAFAQVETICETLGRWGCAAVVTDATGLGGDSYTETLQREVAARRLRCAVEGFTFTSVSKAQVIDDLVICMQRRRLRFPPHPVLLGELANFEATPTPGGRERLEAAAGHDDTVCALALAVRAAAPWLARAGGAGLIIGSGGRRRGIDRTTEEFSACGTGLATSGGASSPRMRGAHLRPLSPTGVLSRLLGSVYACEAGRSAGARVQALCAFLARTSSRRRATRPGATR